MTVRVLDIGNVERTISQIKVMDVGNVERTIAFVRVMDVGGVVREVFTAGGGGGGGGGGGTSVSISPAYQPYSGGKPPSRSGIFEVNLPAGATATSYEWGLIDGNGRVSAGGTTGSATLTVYGTPSENVQANFYCNVVIAGTTYRAECTLSFDYEGR